MGKTWEYFSSIDDLRPESDFRQFKDQLPDPRGNLDQWLEGAVVTPLSSKEWRCRPDWRVGPRVLNDCLWYLFPDSYGWYYIENYKIKFEPGSLMIIPQGVEHTVILGDGDTRTHMAAHFHAKIFGSIDLVRLLGFPFYLAPYPDAPWHDVMNRLNREFALKAPGWRKAMASDIFGLILYLIREHGKDFRPFGSERIHKDLIRILPALEYIDAHIQDPERAVGDLAAQVHVSEVYLRKIFHEVTLLSPVAFIQRRRVEKACAQLRQSERPIKEIAHSVGFEDLPFFYRIFKKWTGEAPARYRESLTQ